MSFGIGWMELMILGGLGILVLLGLVAAVIFALSNRSRNEPRND